MKWFRLRWGGSIQRRRAAVSVSTLRNDVKRSVWAKQDCVNISRFCDHYMVCSQNARRLSARWNLKKIENAIEKKLKSVTNFLWETTSRKAILQISYNNMRRETESRIVEWVVRSPFILCHAFLSKTLRVNMVAAIDWCSHTTHDWIWLVSCFGFNGPLWQYFSLYRAVSQRVRKKRNKIDERKNVQTMPTRTYCKCNRPLPYYYPNQ